VQGFRNIGFPALGAIVSAVSGRIQRYTTLSPFPEARLGPNCCSRSENEVP